MNLRDFIFYDDTISRLRRHLTLWVACYLFLVLSHPPHGTGSPGGIETDGFITFYSMVLIRALFHLCCQMIFCYPLLYILMPVFFWKKRYFQFICLFLLLWIAVSLFRYAAFTYAYNPIMQQLNLFVNPPRMILMISFMQTINGPAFIGFLFISLKLFKDWQQKQRNNFDLQKENARAEIQFLKAQIHPHFLFNTLNNIYSFTVNESPDAKHAVKRLEHMLHYMIEECEQPFVRIEDEIRIIKDYFELERIRYGNNLDLESEISGDFKNKLIAPLLMIPFLENCFKHGTSKMRSNPWIRLSISLKNNFLFFQVSNSRPDDEGGQPQGGIGLHNVRKRLELLYHSNHMLTIEPAVSSFTVSMRIPVHELTSENYYSK